MGHSDYVRQLILSLTKGEKRMIRQRAKVQPGKKDYMVLFDAMNKQSYNEKAILKKLGYPKPNPSFYILKNYLLRFILKVLRANCEIPACRMDQYHQNTRMLMEKGLNEQAERFLVKGLALAQKEERFSQGLELSRLCMELQQREDRRPCLGEIQTYREEMNRLNMNLFAYENLYVEYLPFTRSLISVLSKGDVTRIRQMGSHSLLENPVMAQSARAKRCYWGLKFVASMVEGDFIRAQTYTRNLIDLFDNHPFLIADHQEDYHKALVSLGRLQLLSNETTQLPTTLATIRLLSLPEGKIGLQLNQWVLELCQANHTGSKLIGSEPAKKLESVLSDEKLFFTLSNRLEACYYLSVYYFSFGEMAIALFWLRKVIETNSATIRNDLRCFARILCLLCAYELEDPHLLDYYARSAYRYIYNRSFTSQFPGELLKTIKSASVKPISYDCHNFLRKQLEKLETLMETPTERSTLIYFDALTWLRGKLAGKTIAEMNRENVPHESKIGKQNSPSNPHTKNPLNITQTHNPNHYGYQPK